MENQVTGNGATDNAKDLELSNPKITILQQSKKSAWNWQERRHPDWSENYTLYRDKVVINRLSQRQSVNVPLMKTAIKTALKDVDDPPLLYFENLDSNKDKEIFYNEYFKYCSEQNKLVLKDIVDKKQVFLYGRSFKKLNIVDGQFSFEILDPQDVLVDRYVDPTNLDSAHYICHQHIFKPISAIINNPKYDKEAVERLRAYMATNLGLLKADQNLQTVSDRNERMRQMGVPDVDNPILGETYVEINEHYLKEWDEKLGQEVFNLYVTAEGVEVLMEKALEDVIGKTKGNFWRTHTPLNTWGDDIERTDFWSDGMADTIRTPNKILNSWISQLVENRTLRNFGMNFYDASKEGFTPQSYEPQPFGWYGLPGKPGDVYQRVDIPDLSEAIDEMNFIMQLAEKASAATSIQQGASQERKITLGEVEILMANASERIKSMSVFYTDSWKDFGIKYIKMLEAAGHLLDEVKLYKKGLYNDQMYGRTVKPKDWYSRAGYTVKVMAASEKEDADMQSLQKLNAVVQSIPGNTPLVGIYQKKLLEFGGLTPDEIKEVTDFEKQKQQVMPGMPGATGPEMNMQPGAMQGAPVPNIPANVTA